VGGDLCTLAPSTGTGNSTVTATFTPNTHPTESRSGDISFVSTDGTNLNALLNVQQAPGAPVTLTASPISLANQNGTSVTATLQVTCNSAWTATVASGDWCTINPASGQGNGTIAVTLTANRTGAVRSTQIDITPLGVEQPVQVVVSQNFISASGDGNIEITSGGITAQPNTAGTVSPSYTVTFNSKVNWTATIDGVPGWISIDPASGASGNNITLTVTVNYFTGAAGNATKIVIENAGDPTDYQDVTITDGYAAAALTLGSKQWAPTDLRDPGQFAPAIGRGKVYQHGRNYGWDALEVSPNFPKSDAGKAEVTVDNVVLPAYPGDGHTEAWTNTPCPAGWTLPGNVETKADNDFKTATGVCTTSSEETIDGLKFRNAGGLHIPEWNIEEGGGTSNRSEIWTKEGDGNNTQSSALNFKSGCYSRAAQKGLWVRCIKAEE
jgi:hypothetical protein